MIGGLARRAKGQKSQTVALPIEAILPDPGQPRKSFPADGLSSLAQGLLETGQIDLIVVRLGPEGKYIIVVGERRWRAAREAGLSYVECIVRHDIDEQKALEMQLTENSQREDIPPLEQARSFASYVNRYKVSQSELSRRTGIPRRTIFNRLGLLSLPASLQARIEAGAIGPYEALSIATLPDDEQEAVAEVVASGRIGGRALEKLIRESSQGKSRVGQEALQPAQVAETTFDISQRLENLEKAVYELAATYAFNETAKERGDSSEKALPCPECLKRGERGSIRGIKRRLTARDRRELIEIMKDANELDDEEEARELMGPEPTYIVEAKCRQCDYTEFIAYAWE